MPVALISTSTSPARGPSRSTSTISSGFFDSKASAARVFIGWLPPNSVWSDSVWAFLEPLRMEGDMVGNEAGDEKIGMVVARLHAQPHNPPRRLRRAQQTPRLELAF